MEVTTQPFLQLIGVDFVNVQANMIAPFLKDDQPKIDIAISPKVFYPSDKENNFTIIIDLKVKATDFFEIDVVAFGGFFLNRSVKDAESKAFININAPAIMFPYVRSFLTTLTANLGTGYPPLVLPAQFFKGDLEEYVPIVEKG